MNAARFIRIASDPKGLLIKLNYNYPLLFSWMPDELNLKFWYKYNFGKKLDLKNPNTFNEKLQWLKLYNRKDEYVQMVDKYEVKKYVAGIIGPQYIIPTLGVWNSFDEIEFEALPDQFVLKCTHDSGGLIICKEKEKVDWKSAKKKIQRCLKRNYYWVGREWPYKNVQPRIIAEAYMQDVKTRDLKDYKFFCFNGKPKYCQVIGDRSKNESMDFFDMNWSLQPFTKKTFAGVEFPHDSSLRKPICFDEMVHIVGKLAVGIPMSRIDLYEINNKVYFGEITFFPNSGLFNQFSPVEWDVKLGRMISLR